PMISKLVVWGETRDEAIRRMARALDEYQVQGIRTNLPFHSRVMLEPDFRAGTYDTGYIEAHKGILLAPYAVSDDDLRTAMIAGALHAATSSTRTQATQTATDTDQPSAWRTSTAHWRR